MQILLFLFIFVSKCDFSEYIPWILTNIPTQFQIVIWNNLRNFKKTDIVFGDVFMIRFYSLCDPKNFSLLIRTFGYGSNFYYFSSTIYVIRPWKNHVICCTSYEYQMQPQAVFIRCKIPIAVGYICSSICWQYYDG